MARKPASAFFLTILGCLLLVSCGGGGSAAVSSPTTIDLQIANSHNGAFTAGANGSYTLAVSNVGNAATTGTITVSDTLPTGLTFVSGTGTGWTCTAAVQIVTCTNNGPIAGGAAAGNITLTVTLSTTVSGTLSNTATVATAGDTNAANNSSTDTVTANQQTIDLQITNSHNGTFATGANGTYTLAVSNVGNAATTGTITVSDTLPTGLTFVSASGTGWTCTAAGLVVTCTNTGPIAGGAAAGNITLTVTLSTTVSGTLSNTATVATAGDTNAANNSSTDSVTVTIGPVLLSHGSGGTVANGRSQAPAMDDAGRFVAFESFATNLLASGNPTVQAVYAADTCRSVSGCTPGTLLVSVADDGSLPNGACGTFIEQTTAVSADGRYYAFDCTATNLVPGGTSQDQIFVRDTCLNGGSSCVKHTLLVSQDNTNTGVAGNSASGQVSISSTGRFIVFASASTNLVVPNTAANLVHIYLRDTCIGAAVGCVPQTVLISQNSSGVPANVSSLGGSVEPWVDGAGRFVVFSSAATNLDLKATASMYQVYIRDTCGFPSIGGCIPSTKLAVLNTAGNEANNTTGQPEISPDGRYIVFAGQATDLVNGGPVPNAKQQIYVRDTCFGAAIGCVPANTPVAIGVDGLVGNDDSFLPSINSSGRFIGWTSKATNLVTNDTNNHADAFVRDTCLGGPVGCTPMTVLISKNALGVEGNGDSSVNLPKVSISGDGKVSAFASTSTNLAANSTGLEDVFFTATSF